MRFFHALIGLMFDLVMLAAAAAGVAVAVRPGLLDQAYGPAVSFLSTATGRIDVAVGAAVLLILSLRGVLLVLFSQPDRQLTLRSNDSGALTISQSSLSRILERIIREKAPAGDLIRSAVSTRDNKFDVQMKVRLDLVGVNLNEYSALLEERIRDHFANTLGIPIGSVNIQAECAPAPPSGR